MVPFFSYKKDYSVKQSTALLEEKFRSIEDNPSKFHHEINATLLDASLKQYHFLVPVTGWMIFGMPVRFSKTTMKVRLSEQNGNTKIETVIQSNPLYLLSFILVVTAFAANSFKTGTLRMPGGVLIYLICMAAAVIADIISKKILSATFERFI
ncbi:MAG: hypothetical protein U0V75_03735 [Ferruginibacter sp.]